MSVTVGAGAGIVRSRFVGRFVHVQSLTTNRRGSWHRRPVDGINCSEEAVLATRLLPVTLTKRAGRLGHSRELGGREHGKKTLIVVAVELHEPKGFGRCRMRIIPDPPADSLHPLVRKHIELPAPVITDG